MNVFLEWVQMRKGFGRLEVHGKTPQMSAGKVFL